MKIYTLSRALRYLTIPGAAGFLTWSLFPPYYGSTFRRAALVIGCVYIWYRILLTPYKIKIHDDNLVEFISIIKTIKIYPKDIESIEEFETTPAIKVHHAKGTTKISSLFDNLTCLKGTLKSFCSERIKSKETNQNENIDKVNSTNTL